MPPAADLPVWQLGVFTPGIPQADFTKGFKSLRSKLLAVPGVRSVAHAFEHETPTNLRLFVNWASSKDHETFRDSDEYNPYLLHLSELLGGPPIIAFADLRPLGLPTATAKPAGQADADAVLQPGKSTTTESVTIFFPLDISSDAQALCERNMGQFMRKMKDSKPDGLTGIVYGWTLDDTPAPMTKAMSKSYVMLFGWTAIEKHMEFTKGDVFKEIWPLYQEVYDKGQALEMEMYHVQDLEIADGALKE